MRIFTQHKALMVQTKYSSQQDIIWALHTLAKLKEIDWFRFTVGRIGDFNSLAAMASRTGQSGELGNWMDT